MTTSKPGRASFSSAPAALLAIPYSVTPGPSRNFDLSTSTPADASTYPVPDPPYLSSQLKSADWLQRYGLHSQKLTFDQILQQIGFKRVESFTPSVGKTVGAKYAGNLYHEVQHDNGDRYVLTCRPEKLREYRNRLVRLLNLLRKRLTFITSGSRRAFGILGEPSVCLVCDCKHVDQRVWNQFQSALTSLLKEQVTKIKRFNLIWVSNDNEQFQAQPVDVTSASVDQAIDWITDRKYSPTKASVSATCEAILKAFNQNVHSIYLITEGDSSDSAREMLRDNIVKTRLASSAPKPINVVSLFCHNGDTEVFLRSIAQTASGSYVSYKIKSEVTDLRAPANAHDPTRITLQDNKVQFGSTALSAKLEYPIDVSLMYKEIIQCENIIDRLEKILGFIHDENENSGQSVDTTKSLDVFNTSKQSGKPCESLQRSLIIQSSALFNNDENDMASIEWLKIYGIDAQRLDFFTILQTAAFRHCDGMVTLYQPPNNPHEASEMAPAYGKEKLVNARYCDQFAHVAWPDGTIRHVYVTPELHRNYERRMQALLEKIRARLSWLKKGSRDVFGTILEKNIYILIDTSKSMQNHLNFVKDKLRLLIQDQLSTRERVNMVSFNSTINPWRDRLTKIANSNIQTQLQQWIEGLHVEGSTNTLAALRFALADPDTEAMYLLTDGRPDQNERHILSQVQYRQSVPVHTIAFNCQDHTANQFLFDLSRQTGGRFHAFNYGYENSPSIELPESEDLSYLKKELSRGEKDLERAAALRDECMGRAWSKDNLQSQYKTPPVEALLSSPLFRSQSTANFTRALSPASMPQRLDRRKYATTASVHRKHLSKSRNSSFQETNALNLNPDQWLLPETAEYLRNNVKTPTQVSARGQDTPRHQSLNQTVPVDVSREAPSAYDQVRSYLKRNSLVAKRLTIFDVLHPTSVNIKGPQHIQVIDRYVLSKVWNDLSPLIYGSYVNKFRMVNQYTADLENYEMNLKELLAQYHQFLSTFMWKCLDDKGKEQLGPHLYWMTLSQENQLKYARELTEEERKDQNALELYIWRKLTKTQQDEILKKPVSYREQTATVLEIALRDAEDPSALEGVALMKVEIKRAMKFLQISTDIRRHQKRAETESKEKPKPKPIVRAKSAVYPRFAQRVLSRYDGDGRFYPGTVQMDVDGRSIVLFDMEIEQDAARHVLLPLDHSSSQLSLVLMDSVLVQQNRQTEEAWVPGLVKCLPAPFALPPQLYMVEIYDPTPRCVYVPRQNLYRITLALFQRTVTYIQNIESRDPRPYIPPEPSPTPQPPSGRLSEIQLENMLRVALDPLSEKIDHLDRADKRRYRELQSTLEDQMGAIRLLQQQQVTRPVRYVYVQTDRTTTPGPWIPTTTVIPGPPVTLPPPGPPPLSPEPSLLAPNTHVYALWPDDILFDEGIIVRHVDSYLYEVERVDLPGVRSDILRMNIFLNSDQCLLKDWHSNPYALIKYPDDCRGRWWPAVILSCDSSKARVRFYDCSDIDMDADEKIIPITERQFKRFVSDRIDKENAMLGRVVVGLNNQKKVFMLGTAEKRTGSGYLYQIKWCDNSTSEQEEGHLFGAFSRMLPFRRGGYVLALEEGEEIYRPGRIQGVYDEQRTLVVQYRYQDSWSREIEISANTAFVITEPYFKIILRLLKT